MNTLELHMVNPCGFIEKYLVLRVRNILDTHGRIALWGVGKHSEYLLDILPIEMLKRIVCFIDDDASP